MANKLSHSALGKYQSCGEAYRLHYISRIRSKYQSAALAFGSAIDAALNELLLPTGKEAEVLFNEQFTNAYINNKAVYLPTCIEVVYQNNDFDSDLLIEDDYKDIEEAATKNTIDRHTDYLEIYNLLRDKKSKTGFDGLTVKERTLYNLMNWLCLRRKGLLMLSAYRKKVLPKLTKVHAVQKQVSLKNTEGDSVTGYVDLIADVEGEGRVILDNKTSSMEYDKDAVLTSAQLSLYVHMLEEEYKTRKAGYIVMRKSIIKNRKKVCSKCGHNGSGGRHKTCDALVDGKRCNGEWNETIDPDVHIQFIVDEIPPQTERIVLENFDATNEAIKAGHFTRNFNSCHNSFGSKCVYFDLCYRSKMNGLVDLNKGEDI